MELLSYQLKPSEQLSLDSKRFNVEGDQIYQLSISAASVAEKENYGYLAVIVLDKDYREIRRVICWLDHTTEGPREYRVIFKPGPWAEFVVIGYRINTENAKPSYCNLRLQAIESVSLVQISHETEETYDELWDLNIGPFKLAEQKVFWDKTDPELKHALKTSQCNICGYKGGPFFIRKLPKFDWAESFSGDLDLRESLICRFCGSSSRDRMLIWWFGKSLSEVCPLIEWKQNKRIHILESSGSRAHPAYLEQKFDYRNTFYDPLKIREQINPSSYADFQNLHYDDESFDFVLSSDTFEHIRLDVKAFREVYRVLKNEGKFILQVPYCNDWPKTLVKVRPVGDRDVFLLTPEYHGENILVYRIYGRDLLTLLQDIGFSVDYICTKVPEAMISLQPIIVCTK